MASTWATCVVACMRHLDAPRQLAVVEHFQQNFARGGMIYVPISTKGFLILTPAFVAIDWHCGYCCTMALLP